MGKVVAWLSANWLSVLTVLGGMSGYASVAWSVHERRLRERGAVEARLKVETHRTAEGFLKVTFTFDPPDRAEPYSLVVKASDRKGLILYNAVTVRISDGQGGTVAAGMPNLIQSRQVEVPFHHWHSGLLTTAVFVARAGSEGSAENIESGRVTIRVVSTASRKRLIETTRTISARA